MAPQTPGAVLFLRAKEPAGFRGIEGHAIFCPRRHRFRGRRFLFLMLAPPGVGISLIRPTRQGGFVHWGDVCLWRKAAIELTRFEWPLFGLKRTFDSVWLSLVQKITRVAARIAHHFDLVV